MATTIKLKNSVTTTNAPSSLVQGEVAINITDKKVWVGNAATTPIQLLGDGASLNFTSLSLSGNLTFTGTGNRITGDFSNATVANRVAFQTSTTNANTNIQAIPNGTAVNGGFLGFNNSDPTNAAFIGIATAGGTEARLTSGITGTGTYLPLTMYTGGSERLRIDTSGNVGIGTTTPSSYSGKLVVSGVANVYGDERKILNLIDTTALASGVGAGISFWGTSESGGGASQFGSIKGVKENATSANYAGALAFVTSNSSNVQTERMRIDSSGNVGIGTSSPSTKLDVSGIVTSRGSGNAARFSTVDTDGGGATILMNAAFSGAGTPAIQTQTNHPILFATNNTERMRISSGGDVMVAKTTLGSSTVGCELRASGLGVFTASAPSSGVVIINRNTDDGTLIDFRQDNTLEGTITVSGSTVSYNGGHLSRWSQLPNAQKDNTLLKGTVMSNLDDMCVWTKDGEVLPNEQLNKMKVSDVEGDTNVAGVFVNWTRDEDCNSDDMNVAMTGDMIIRIAEGVVVQKGDLLMSAGDGTAKPQGDDIRRSKTVAKVTSNHVTCTYADGSYCVPCVLMAC